MKPSVALPSFGPAKASLLLLWGAVLCSLSGCAVQPRLQPALSQGTLTSTRYTYPPPMIQNFMETCVSHRGSEVEAVCTCTINKLQDRYTAQQFAKYDAQMIETKEPPERMVMLLKSCQRGPGKQAENDPSLRK
ncbi:MAG: hypothetical protein SFW36_09035 [Leptolyngbyaceae cyanobacterium bins.59]|nr:hypothetical protein [Leptolyngbyaceae cyanobacterium bins.59]